MDRDDLRDELAGAAELSREMGVELRKRLLELRGQLHAFRVRVATVRASRRRAA
jgi:hypothetical protein